MNRERILDGAKIGLIDAGLDLDSELKPKFVYNNIEEGISVVSTIKKELSESTYFCFSVAFITKSGIQYLKNRLNELEEKGVKGRILTTNFLGFNEPDSFLELLKFKNLEIRVSEENMHTKGYMFHKKEGIKVALLGSSNLTMNALKKNVEWNIKINSLENGEIVTDIEEEFNKIWEKSQVLTHEWIDNYKNTFIVREKILKKEKIIDIESYKLVPNRMQVAALKELSMLRKSGENRGLLISSTGTGKTYLSAFDVREYNPKKVLFIAHREQILKQARESYSKVLPKSKASTILSGNTKDKERIIDYDLVFATIQTISKDNVLELFDKEHFDYIVIDETHRAASSTYLKIIDYFKPEFLLGMTATPERTDCLDIYRLYDYNIAYEVRLEDAMKNDLLCPFFYFGITDITVDGKSLDETSEFKDLVTDERVKHIIEKANFFGYSGDRVKGLIFCSRTEEAKELSKKINELGYRTVALDGGSSENYRTKCIELLESDSKDDYLDYIITVDIFNEGVDIPSVNQIIMLRPTQSPIIFIQQLGRGLRKYNNKDFVTVIDFIGNYKNNYMIPIALSGDRRGKKYELRKFIGDLDRSIPGLCNVEFDRITRERIYKSIDVAKLKSKRLYVEHYNKLKNMIGRVPDIEDFDKHGILDPIKLFSVDSPIKYKEDGKNIPARTYYRAIKTLDPEWYKIEFSREQELMMQIVCQKVINGKRIHELLLLKNMIEFPKVFMEKTKEDLLKEYGITLDLETLKSAVLVLSGEFETQEERRAKFREFSMIDFEVSCSSIDRIAERKDEYSYKNCDNELDEYFDRIKISKVFSRLMRDKVYKEQFSKLVDYSIKIYNRDYSCRYKDTNLCLYKTYTYEDVCRLLNWDTNVVATNIGGYKYDRNTNTFPVFINYEKSEKISDTIKYEDAFINKRELKAISKRDRTINSNDIKTIYSQKENGVKIYLFVRKNAENEDSKEFYFLGEMYSIHSPKEFIMPNTNHNAVEIQYRLHTPVKEDIYEYLTKSES